MGCRRRQSPRVQAQAQERQSKPPVADLAARVSCKHGWPDNPVDVAQATCEGWDGVGCPGDVPSAGRQIRFGRCHSSVLITTGSGVVGGFPFRRRRYSPDRGLTTRSGACGRRGARALRLPRAKPGHPPQEASPTDFSHHTQRQLARSAPCGHHARGGTSKRRGQRRGPCFS